MYTKVDVERFNNIEAYIKEYNRFIKIVNRRIQYSYCVTTNTLTRFYKVTVKCSDNFLRTFCERYDDEMDYDFFIAVKHGAMNKYLTEKEGV